MKLLQMMLFGALLGGCTVMVNGKPRRIGGGDDPAPQAAGAVTPQAAGAATTPTARAAQPTRGAAPTAARPPGQVVRIEPALGRDPLIVAFDAALDTTWSKVFGHGSLSNSPDCGLNLTSRPIGSFQISQPDTDLQVSVHGGRNDGFVIRKGDQFWTACTHSAMQVPTMGPIQGGWQPGRYDIYPVARSGSRDQTTRFSVELYRPNAPVVAAADNTRKLVISGKLDKPLFVELSTRTGRRVLREAHAGHGCAKVALPATPDLALVIERPIPGLVISMLPTTAPVTLRKEAAATGERRADKGCVKSSAGRKSGQPSYAAASELRLDKVEGELGISLGTEDPGEETRVTLMVFDASTTFDQLAVRPFGGEQPTLEQRWVGYQLPQLDTDAFSGDRYARAELAARVFAATPPQALVYAKLTFDKDIGGGDGYPVKNEPLVLVGLDRQQATVLTADGLKFRVKASHLLLSPADGPAVLPATPRPLRTLDIGAAIALLPPSAKALGDAHYAAVKARDACLDRAWEPYRRQLPSYTRPSNVEVIVYKSARTKRIEEAGHRAMDKKCGTRAAFAKQTEARRDKLAVVVEKARAQLLVEATAALR